MARPDDELTRQLLAAQEGDRRSLGAFIRGTEADVWRLCAHLVNRTEADDVTQEVYVRAWRALPAYRGDAPARAWLLAIARRTCADAVRQLERRRRRVHLFGQRTTSPDPATDIGIRDLVARLPAPRKDAFVLTQLVGLSYDEAAAVCGCRVGTIRSRVARARDDLIASLAADEATAKHSTAPELRATLRRPVGHEV